MLMMTSWILKSADFAKTQKSRYLENETLHIHIHIKGYFMTKNRFVAEVTFKQHVRLIECGKMKMNHFGLI